MHQILMPFKYLDACSTRNAFLFKIKLNFKLELCILCKQFCISFVKALVYESIFFGFIDKDLVFVQHSVVKAHIHGTMQTDFL